MIVVPQQFRLPTLLILEFPRHPLYLVAEFLLVVFLLADEPVRHRAVLAAIHVAVPGGVGHDGEAAPVSRDAGGIGGVGLDRLR